MAQKITNCRSCDLSVAAGENCAIDSLDNMMTGSDETLLPSLATDVESAN